MKSIQLLSFVIKNPTFASVMNTQSMNVEHVAIGMKMEIYTTVVLSALILCLQKHIILHLLIVTHCLVPQETSVLDLNKLHTLTLMSVLTKLVGSISLHN